MKDGETGVIKEFISGHNFLERIQNMGLRPGKTLKKISSHFWRGPQTVEVDKMRVAIGYGMAKKIMIEVDR
jgi:ferrous iron transport protein A